MEASDATIQVFCSERLFRGEVAEGTHMEFIACIPKPSHGLNVKVVAFATLSLYINSVEAGILLPNRNRAIGSVLFAIEVTTIAILAAADASREERVVPLL